jgi:hypothetical protein
MDEHLEHALIAVDGQPGESRTPQTRAQATRGAIKASQKPPLGQQRLTNLSPA